MTNEPDATDDYPGSPAHIERLEAQIHASLKRGIAQAAAGETVERDDFLLFGEGLAALESGEIQPRHAYSVEWSPEDQECVGTCDEYPSLSWLAPNRREALDGIRALVTDVERDPTDEERRRIARRRRPSWADDA